MPNGSGRGDGSQTCLVVAPLLGWEPSQYRRLRCWWRLVRCSLAVGSRPAVDQMYLALYRMVLSLGADGVRALIRKLGEARHRSRWERCRDRRAAGGRSAAYLPGSPRRLQPGVPRRRPGAARLIGALGWHYPGGQMLLGKSSTSRRPARQQPHGPGGIVVRSCGADHSLPVTLFRRSRELKTCGTGSYSNSLHSHTAPSSEQPNHHACATMTRPPKTSR